MPQLLSRVGKALGNILRAPGGNDPSGRNRSSGDSDAGLHGSKRGRASGAGVLPDSELSLRQRSDGQTESLESLGSSTSQSVDQLDAADRAAAATVADVSGRTPASCTNAGGDAAAATGAVAAPVPTVGPANGAVSDAGSLTSCSSPPAAPQFFRASRASLSDATASAAGEALRQASVTTCKHFTRENYNNYVRWVRASRGVMKIAGKIRSRVEPTARNPNPTLLLRCEHWLEVTDEQHRYGSNLRVYFDYWVAEMEAAELTPPASPALMSPSPSYGHLVALATAQQQQHQQNNQQLLLQQLAGAIASAAMGERASPSAAAFCAPAPDHRLQKQPSQQQDLQQPIAASVAVAQSAYPGQINPLPPLPPHQPQTQREPLPNGAPGPQQVGTCATACQNQAGAGHSPGPGPSRFSNDACAAPRAAVGSSMEARGHSHDDKPQQPQQRNGQLQQHRVHHHYHHHHQNHHHTHHHNHHNLQHHHLPALARGRREQAGEGDGLAAGDSALGSQSSRPPDDSQLLSEEQEQQEVDTASARAQLHDGQRRDSQQQRQHYRRHHAHHDLELYEREGSVHRATDDGGGGSTDGLPVCMSLGRSHDGGDDDEGPPSRAEPLSPSDAADTDAAARPRASSVRFVSGSCDPPPTLLHRRHLQQQTMQQQVDLDPQQQLQQLRRRSCGETDMPAARHPAAAQQRPSSGAVSVLLAPTPSAQPLCGSPRRNVLCSPSRRFMLAAMIDMSPVEAEQTEEQPQKGQGVSGRCQGEPSQDGKPSQESGGLQLPQGVFASWGVGDATSAAQGSFGTGCAGGAGGGGGVPPATPLPQVGSAQAVSSLPPATPAQNSCGGTAAASCAAARAAKLLSNRVSVGSGTSFFRWLDNGPGLDVDLAHLGVPRAKLDAERVKYLTPDELLEYELDVEIETGLLRYKRSGKLLHTGPDGRGSLDEHRRPPTPPPPAVPLDLLGESAAAWWRGSSMAAAEPPPPVPIPSFSQAVGVAAAPAQPPRNPSAGARQALRRIAPMGTVLEGFSGDGSSGESPEPPGQMVLAISNAIEATATAAAVMPGADGDLSEGPHGSCAAVPDSGKAGAGGGAATDAAAAASMLPDLELRGHSASSLARLERSGDACYSAKEGSGVDMPAAGSSSSSSAADSGCGSGSGDGDGSTRPCSSTETGLAAVEASASVAAAAAAATVLSVGAAEAGSGGFAPRLAPPLAAEARRLSSNAIAAAVGYEDLAAAAAKSRRAAVALCAQPAGPAAEAAVLRLPGVEIPEMTASREAAPATPGGGDGDGMSTPTAATAVAAGGGTFASPIGGGLDAAGGSMPRTPVAAPQAGGGGGGGVHGGGGGYHHEETKVTKWIYVVDPELRLFVHPKVRGRFHHSSFLRGGAVVAAGGLAARHGRLRLLTADSGHYWPREENFRWLCEHLVYVGADLSACELKSKHMPVPAATGKELMEKMGVPPPWRLSYVPLSSPSGPPGAAGPDAPPSPLAEHMHLLQLQDVEADAAGRGAEAETEAGAVPPAAEAAKRG